MKRTEPVEIPDAINCSAEDNFTRVPNDMLRNPDLSAKAKGILSLLLSNKDGWSSYVETIIGMMKDGETAVRSGLAELEEHEFLIRFRCRDKDDKQFQGMFWAYTDQPGDFNFERVHPILDERGLEIVRVRTTTPSGKPRSGKPRSGKPKRGKPRRGKPGTNNTNSNNTKERKRSSSPNSNNQQTNEDNEDGNGKDCPNEGEQNNPLQLGVEISNPNDKITPSMFTRFWSMYPRKVDKGRSKKIWKKICRMPPQDRPAWRTIKAALRKHERSPQWQDPGPKKEYIPYPSTWLNQERWHDDPEDMPQRYGEYSDSPSQHSASASPREIIQDEFDDILARGFIQDCYEPASYLMDDLDADDETALALTLIDLYQQIAQAQRGFTDEQRRLVDGPAKLVEEYVEWLLDQKTDWMDSVSSLSIFDTGQSLFQRFCREYKGDGSERHPLTGRA